MQGCVLLRKEWKGPNSSRLVNNLGSPHKQEVKTKAALEKAPKACRQRTLRGLSKGQQTGSKRFRKSLLTSWALTVRTSLPHPLTDAKFTKLMQETHNTKPKKRQQQKALGRTYPDVKSCHSISLKISGFFKKFFKKWKANTTVTTTYSWGRPDAGPNLQILHPKRK